MCESQLDPKTRAEGKRSSQRLLRLLLIEDVDDIQAILQFSLETLSGWHIITAKSHHDWLTLAQQESPDAILLDGYPDFLDILTALKANPVTREIPVVGLVARDRLTDQLQMQQDGAAAIVGKPFDPIVLVTTILALVETHAQAKNVS